MSLYDLEAAEMACLAAGANGTLPWGLSPPDELIFPDPSVFQSNNNNSCNGSQDFIGAQPRELSVLHALNVYVTPVIVLVGITGNLLNFLVFATTHLKRQSSSVYLAFLSVADIGFLIALLIIWFQHCNVPIFHINIICQIVVYVTYIGKFMSVWLVASFTVERYVIVCYPFKRSKLCTPRRAKMVVLGLSSFGFLLYSFAPWTSGTVQIPGGSSICMPLPRYYNLLTVCEFVDVLITLIIPFMAIAVLNVRIVIKIHQFRKQMKHVDMKHSLSNTAPTTVLPTERARPSLVRTSFSTEGTLQFTFRSRYASATRDELENTAQTKVMRLRKGSQYRTAKMLLVVSSVFLILNLPSHVMRLHAFIRRTVVVTVMDSSDDLRWSELFLIPYHLNFAINFFLYSACGRPFRRGLKCIYHRFTYRIHKCYSVTKRTKGWDLGKAENEAAIPIHEHFQSPEKKE